MASIDERVVSMAFENAKFEAGIAKTLQSLNKLDETLKKVGSTSGLGDIDKAASKITFSGLGSSIDKIKAKLDFTGSAKSLDSVETASSRISFGPLSSAIDTIKGKLSSFADAPSRALDSLKSKLSFGREAAVGFSEIETASSKVRFSGLNSAIDTIKGKFHFGEADKGFADVETAANRVNFNGLSTAISGVGNQFGLLEGIASVALGNIVSKAAFAGTNIAKSLTIEPISSGLKEYETGLNSVQTILSNTQSEGATLKDVNATLDELNTYSDKTIYNFGEMAKNIGTFTAAGVRLKPATESIKGIANLAALSGSNSQQAATAMYQLSQAISSGKVGLQDWNSVVNAGMGGAVFQKNLVNTAVAMGTLNKTAVKIDKTTGKLTVNGKSFRESIMAKPGEKPWFTSDVLTGSLRQFTGELTDAQLAKMGFDASQISSIQLQAKSAVDAATKVKTLSQAYDVAKETAQSGFAQTFKILFGDFNEAKKTFTGLSNAINKVITDSSTARNALLSDFKKLGGRTVLIESIKNVFDALVSVIKPIRQAFRDIFPAKTGKDLLAVAKAFRDFTESLKIGPETAAKLRRTFAGFFAVLDIGKQILSGVFHLFANLFKSSKDGAGGFLGLTGSIGDALVKLDEWLKKGDKVKKAFEGIGKVLAFPVNAIIILGRALSNLFTGSDTSGSFFDQFGTLGKVLKPLGAIADVVKKAFSGLIGIFGNLGSKVGPLLKDVANVFSSFGDTVANAITNADFSAVFAAIQTTLIGGIFLTIKKALGGSGSGSLFNINLGSGGLKNLTGSLDGLSGSLKTLQANVRADTLLKISSAIALLSVSVVSLSLVDPKKLASSMTAISIGLGQLVGAMALLTKTAGGAGGIKGQIAGTIQLAGLAATMILLAAAIDVMSIAIIALSRLSFTEIAKGLIGVGGAMVVLSVGIRAMPVYIGPIAVALIPLAIGLVILAGAMKIFATMSLIDIGKGLIGVGAGLTAIGYGTALMGPELLAIGPGLIAVGFGLTLIAGAMKIFATFSWQEMAKGLAGVAGGLIAIAASTALMGPELLVIGPGLIAVAFGLGILAGVLKLLGAMSIGSLAKGIGAIGLSLVTLAAGLTLMAFAAPGAVALLAAAAGLTLLVPVLATLGVLKWSTIFKGLAAIAAALLTIGIVGLVAAPGLVAIGLGLGLLGVGMLAAGLGVNFMAKGFILLGGKGAKGVAVFIAAITGLVAILPKVIIDTIKGLVEIIKQVALLAPSVAESIAKIFISALDVVIKAAPKLGAAAIALLSAFISALNSQAGPLIAAGAKLLVSLLQGISSNIGKIVTLVGSIIFNFISSMASSAPRILGAGVNFILSFVNGIRNNIGKVLSAGASAVVKFLQGVTNNIGKVLSAGARLIGKILEGIATALPNIIPKAANVVVKFLEGITTKLPDIITAGAKFIGRILIGIGDNLHRLADGALRIVRRLAHEMAIQGPKMADAGAKAMITFIEGMAKAVRKNSKPLGAAGADLGIALMEGLVRGLEGALGKVLGKVGEIGKKVIDKLKHPWKVFSPSRVTQDLGGYLMEGLGLGLDQGAPGVLRSASNIGDAVVDHFSTMQKTLGQVVDAFDTNVDINPTITPVLDLTNIHSGAKTLADITKVTPITAAVSYDNAASISTAKATQDAAVAQDVAPVPQQVIKLEQNNYSPEALSTAEIYRRTNNQVSRMKSLIGAPV